MTYIKPMLAAQPKNPITSLGHGWVYDTKLDGIRCIAYVTDGVVTLINRSMVVVTHRFPEVVASLESVFAHADVVLDGEVVALSNSFQDTARRDKQNKPQDVARHLKDYPVCFVAFDCLELGGVDLKPYPWVKRRGALDGVLDANATRHLVTSAWSRDQSFYDTVAAAGMEGVIAKRESSIYRSGRFPDWVKYKVLHSITCIATGYDLGKGARAHFGAMHLTMLDADNKAVRIGVVGTGFNARAISELKASLDAGKAVVVEIECLNVTKDGALRFPVYKGTRTDLSYVDAKLSQLDTIPRT